jgi:predicted RNase H-like HicB family nuclease
VPDLPGCFAIGDTLEETERLIREAIPFHIKGLLADGDPVPEARTRVSSVAVAA